MALSAIMDAPSLPMGCGVGSNWTDPRVRIMDPSMEYATSPVSLAMVYLCRWKECSEILLVGRDPGPVAGLAAGPAAGRPLLTERGREEMMLMRHSG